MPSPDEFKLNSRHIKTMPGASTARIILWGRVRSGTRGIAKVLRGNPLLCLLSVRSLRRNIAAWTLPSILFLEVPHVTNYTLHTTFTIVMILYDGHEHCKMVTCHCDSLHLMMITCIS